MAQFPTSASELVDMLDRMFPEKPTRPEDNRDETLFYGGKRDLVLFLMNLREQSRGNRSKGASRVRP